MSSGQENYYLSLSREDYYVGGGEPPGVWHGKGSEALGLIGTVEAAQLRNLFRGFSPDGARALTQRRTNAEVATHAPGWDLTFSAPKSVSCLWSQLPADKRSDIEDIHYQAVKAALDYLEEVAGETRVGKGGKRLLSASLVFATFEHGTSRALDPQLHTHCLLMNAVVCEDGKTRAASSHSIFREKMAAGALYRAQFAYLLQMQLGLSTRRVRDWFELDGVSPSLVEEFSKRSQAIDEVKEQRQVSSPAALARIAIETRSPKETPSRRELFSQWQATGAAFGWSTAEALSLLEAKELRQRSLPERVSQFVSTTEIFTRRQLIDRVAEAAVGSGWSIEQVISHTDALLGSEREVAVLGNDRYALLYGGEAVDRSKFSLGRSDIEYWTKKYAEKEFRIVMVAVDESAAARLTATFEPDAIYSLDSFLQMVRQEQSSLRSFYERFKSQPDLAHLVGRAGPNILAPLQDYVDSFENELSRKTRSILKRYGPDIGEAVRFLVAKAFGHCPLLDRQTAVFLPEVHKMPTNQLLQVLSAIDMAGAHLICEGFERRKHQQKPLEKGQTVTQRYMEEQKRFMLEEERKAKSIDHGISL